MRKPDLVIKDYLNRWHLIPKNSWLNIYLHQFVGSDLDRAMHDHPWWSISFLLKGTLTEDYEIHTDLGAKSATHMRLINHFLPYFRKATHTHAMILNSKTAWTLFITGPSRRCWGFQTSEGWVPHSKFFKTEVSLPQQQT